MSIAFPQFETRSSVEPWRMARPVSARRVEANRRNAMKSTGPKTTTGKQRVSRNALKHGLCAIYAHLPSESGATFNTFVEELREELCPRTILQRNLFPQIVNLLWNIQRLPEAQSKLFAEEAAKIDVGEKSEVLSSSDVLACRFSADGGNGFILLNRYERSMQNALLRLLRQYHCLKKDHATMPNAREEGSFPPERAWDERKAEAQRQDFAEGRLVVPAATVQEGAGQSFPARAQSANAAGACTTGVREEEHERMRLR